MFLRKKGFNVHKLTKLSKNEPPFKFDFIFLVQVEDGTIAKITEQKIEHDSTTDYIDEHIYDVTCLAEGTTEVAFNIGNSKTGSEQ